MKLAFYSLLVVACVAGGVCERANGGRAAIFPSRAMPARNFHQSSHGFATKTDALSREIPPATQATKSLHARDKQLYADCAYLIAGRLFGAQREKTPEENVTRRGALPVSRIFCAHFSHLEEASEKYAQWINAKRMQILQIRILVQGMFLISKGVV